MIPSSSNPALALIASHDGSNCQAIIDACKEGRLHARVCVIISNNSASRALARARADHIPWAHLSSVTHPEADALDRAILATLQGHGAQLVVLAGYMKKLGPKTLGTFEGRILNSHPALLPRFGGKGMYGRVVHEAVLAAGETETGITIHHVDEQYDHGKIVAQCTIPILQVDDVDTLAARSRSREHAFWIETLQGFLELELGKVVA